MRLLFPKWSIKEAPPTRSIINMQSYGPLICVGSIHVFIGQRHGQKEVTWGVDGITYPNTTQATLYTTHGPKVGASPQLRHAIYPVRYTTNRKLYEKRPQQSSSRRGSFDHPNLQLLNGYKIFTFCHFAIVNSWIRGRVTCRWEGHFKAFPRCITNP